MEFLKDIGHYVMHSSSFIFSVYVVSQTNNGRRCYCLHSVMHIETSKFVAWTACIWFGSRMVKFVHLGLS